MYGDILGYNEICMGIHWDIMRLVSRYIRI
jgi:hypothetical protein